MKTRNNAQKTVNGQVRKMILRGSMVIVSLVFVSWTVVAQNFWEEVLNGNNSEKMLMSEIGNSQVSLEANATANSTNIELQNQSGNIAEMNYEAIESKLEFQVEEYIASDFVEAELILETENWLNSNSELNYEAIESGLELQVEEYNAADFVDSELRNETENWLNSNSELNYEAIELGLELQVEKYHADKYVDAELATETETWMNRNTDIDMVAIEATLFNQVEVYHAAKFVEAELALETENRMTEQEFLINAAAETAMEADEQVDKYAMLQLSLANNNPR